MPRLGVLGWPIRHSRSPALHEAGCASLGLTGWTSQQLPLPPARFAEAVPALRAHGFTGVNVTIPHKEAALALADDATDRARAIGAANTLTFLEGGGLHADNTDAPGILDALAEHGASPAGRDVLVLGAGGSARAAIVALRDAGAADLQVWNRTSERARALTRELGGRWVQEPRAANLVVNCTSVGLTPHGPGVKSLPVQADQLSNGTIVVDLVYRDGGTELQRTARDAGATVVDGLDVLVAQGARSLERWTGRRPDLRVLREAVAG